jgi:polysaccharide chain length determinant protein (PEP-CTERM system associated)
MQNWRVLLLSALSGAWQYRWYGLAVMWAVCVVGWLAVALIPNSFEAEAKVYIDSDTLLRPLLNGLAVSTDPEQEINVMLNTLLTTPNVEQVVLQTDPHAAQMSQVQLHDKIASIQKSVRLRNLGVKNLYSISFSNGDPRYAQQVAQALLSVLVDSNLGNQRRDADDVKTFLDAQIADYENKLRAADKRRADFKTAHLGAFTAGENGDSVVSDGGLVTAKAAVDSAQTVLNEALVLRGTLGAQLAATPPTIDVDAPPSIGIGGAPSSPMSKRSQLAMARSRLDSLRTQYTDDYPDVVSLKRFISRLQAELASSPQDSDNSSTQGIANPTYLMIRTKLTDVDTGVALARARLTDAQKHLEDAKQATTSGIAIQSQYEDLNRDYGVLHQEYQGLVERRESAKISQAVGDQQSSFAFRVVDPPRKPDRPVAPNRILFNLLVLFVGLGAGGGAAVFMSQISGTFMTMEQLTQAFSLAVIGAVTAVPSAAEMAQTRRSVMVFGACIGALLVSYIIVLVMFHTSVQTIAGSRL